MEQLDENPLNQNPLDWFNYEYLHQRPTRQYNYDDLSPETSPRSDSRFDLDPFLAQLQEGFPIEQFPNELLYLILERVDAVTLLNCMYINKKWKRIAINVANADRSNEKWKSIVGQTIHNYQNAIVLKSNNLKWSEFFANYINWYHIKEANIECTHTFNINQIRKINVYKEYIIVVELNRVKYYNMKTFVLERQLAIRQCFEFVETDEMMLIGIQHTAADGVMMQSLKVYGKSDPADFSMIVDASISVDDKRIYYRIENSNCYILNHKHIVFCYSWSRSECTWLLKTVGRYYHSINDYAIAINVLNSEFYMLMRSGQMMVFNRKRQNFEQGMNIRMPEMEDRVQVTLVHLFSVVFGMDADSEFRITRYQTKVRGNQFFKFECPNLSCVMEHGEILFLGYHDGKVELYMPRAPDRNKMLKRRINIAEIDPGCDPESRAVVGLEAFEEAGRMRVLVATRPRLYNLLVSYPDQDMWIDHQFPEILPLCLRPVRERHEL